MKSNHLALSDWIWSGITIITLIALLVLVMGGFADEYTVGLNELNCCGGQQCTDTYYTPEDNKCHRVLCDANIVVALSSDDCTYEGANKTFDNLLND